MNKNQTFAMILACGVAFFLGMESSGFQLVLLEVAGEFALNPVVMGGVVTSQYAAIFLGPLLFGWISDRVGKKTVLLFSMVIFMAGCFGASLSTTTALFSLAVFVVGFGFSISECISSSLLSDSFPGKEGPSLNLAQCFFSFGAVLSPLIFGRLIRSDLVSWRIVFVAAGLGYVLVYPILILFREKRNKPEPSRDQQKPLSSGSTPGIFSLFFAVLFFLVMVNVAIEVGVGYFADSLFVTEYGKKEFGAYAISGFWLFMALSRLLCSRLNIKPHIVVLAGFALVSLLLLVSLPFGNIIFTLIVFFLLGSATGPVWPMLIGMGAAINQKRSGTLVSILMAAGGLGGIIMPVLIGLAAERYGFYRSFWVIAIFSTIGFLVILFGSKKYIRD
jgi:FHS family glucose/mannose:H+ symporter-like MFS transporter